MSRPSAEIILERFKNEFFGLVQEHNLFEFMDLDPNCEPDAPLDLLLANNINPADFVASINWDGICQVLKAYPNAGHEGRRLVVAPCSPLFASILDQFASDYHNIAFLDINRAGTAIGGKTIEHPSEFEVRDGDLCLILTRNMDACESYEKQFGRDNSINWLDAYIKRFKRDLAPTTYDFIDEMNGSHKPALFVSARPMATLNSTIRKMHEDGFSTYWMGSEDVKEAHQTSYATPKVKDIALNGYNVGSLIDFMVVFAGMEHGLAMYHFETIYPPAWDFKRVAICYAGTLAMIRTIKACRVSGRGKLGLYMYDCIKPGVKSYHAGEACGALYQAMVKEAEAVIYSSFTDDFGDMVENAIGQKLPRVHHHRYQTMPTKRQARRTDGWHIAVISVLLEDFWEPSRIGIVPYIRDLIAQGVHIHYYVGNNSQGQVSNFEASLPEDQRQFFHAHTPIHDLEALANELSQYHAGWSLFNMQIFSDMVSNLTDQFTRDAMDLFTPTTLPSVIWSCAAAGLPIICNRSMRAVVDLLPEGMTIPLSFSEIHNLPKILEGLDWQKIDHTPLDNLDISNQIYKLYNFLEDYYDA